MSSKSGKIKQKPVVTPIYQSSTFEFSDSGSILSYQKSKKGYMYTRYGNPTIDSVESRMAELDRAESSLVFSSGMAAISCACLALLRPGDEIASSSPIYGGTAEFFDRFLADLGIRTRYFPAENAGSLEGAVSGKTRLIYLESPTNPNLKIIDLRSAAAIASGKQVFTLMDSTFATPVNQRPLEYGIDAVVHSATKYLGGHSDIMGGVLSGSAKFIEKALGSRKILGSCIDPHQAFLLERGLKTLKIRMERHNRNAAEIASYLSGEKTVKRVIYPGLESHPQHQLAAAQMDGFGGMVSFDLGSSRRAMKFADSLELIKNAASLGGTESLVSLPILTSHYGLARAELEKSGITQGMIRLSVGLEDTGDLIRDMRRAIRRSLR